MTTKPTQEQTNRILEAAANGCAERCKPLIDGLIEVLSETITGVVDVIEGPDSDEKEHARGHLIRHMTENLMEGLSFALLVQLCPTIVEQAQQMAIMDRLSANGAEAAPVFH